MSDSGTPIYDAQSKTTLVDLNMDGVIDDVEKAVQEHPMFGIVPTEVLVESVKLARGLNVDGQVIV